MIIFSEAAKGGIATYLSILMQHSQSIFHPNAQLLFFVPYDECYPPPNAQHHYQFFPQQRGLWHSLRLFFQLFTYLVRYRQRCIYAQSTVAGLISSLLVCMSFGYIRLIYCAHSWSSLRSKGKVSAILSLMIDWFIGHMSREVINLSDIEQRYVRQKRICRHTHLINNALPDLTEEQQIQLDNAVKPDTLHLLFIGRLDYQKGLDILLDALTQYHQATNKEPLHLTVIGDTVVDKQYGQQIKQRLQTQPYITFLGWQNAQQILQQMAQHHIVVSPSRWEGFALTTLEAFRASLPVLASDHGSFIGTVIHQYNGWLFCNENSESLAQMLQQLNIQDAVTAGKQARATYLEHYTLIPFLQKMHHIMQKYP